MKITIFPDIRAASADTHNTSWADLAARCINPPSYPTKQACPLIKLATFGNQRTAKGALRHDANVLSVSGLEGDYDGEKMRPDEAKLFLDFAGITALIYTSPSHTPAKPRWRVLAPLSTEHPPSARRDLLARLNGALGGILAHESFTLSQSYYVGRVEGAEYETHESSGACLDLVTGLAPVYPPTVATASVAMPHAERVATPEVIADLHSALKFIPADDYYEWIAVGQALVSLGDEGYKLWAEWSATSDKHDPDTDLPRWATFNGDRTGFTAVFAKARRNKWENPRRGSGTSTALIFGAADALQTIPGDVWQKPQPIPCSLLPVEAFDSDLLPSALRPWVTDIAERMQCPPDFPAVGVMVALSSVIGRKSCIRPKRHDDWQVVPNLWGAIVGRPGVMKSPALSEVMKPLERLASMAGDLHAEVMRDYEIKLKLEGMSSKTAESQAQKLVAKGNINAAEQLLIGAADAEGNAPPALRRYKVTDASVEALGEILIENPWGTLAYRDELNGLLRSLDKEGQEGARAFYLQGYDGNQGYTFDRIMRGRNLHIPAVCIAMLGGIQPGKLQSYIHDAVSGGAGDDGLLQRFGLLVWPDVCGEWRNVDRWPDTSAKRTAFETFQRLDGMAPGTDPECGENVPVVYRFSIDAQTRFEEWRQEFETALRSGDHHPAMESHLSKYRKLVPAVALVCALADGETEVSKDSLLRALAWADYLQSHATRAYAAGTRPATEGATALLAKIKAGAVADGFKPADVYLKGWAHLATPDSTHAAIGMLCDLQHLRMSEKRPGSTGGRPSITYQINPATMGGE